RCRLCARSWETFMNLDDLETSEFERRVRALLEESVARVDGRVRSRLNRARHAALAPAAEAPLAWRSRSFIPVGAAAAATLAAVAILVWHQHPRHVPVNETGQTSFEDLELLADGEAFELMQDEGAFYEWASTQDSATETSG